MPQNTPPQRIASGSMSMPQVVSPMAQAMRQSAQGPSSVKAPKPQPQLPTTTPALAALQNTVFTQAQPMQQELLVNRIQKSAAVPGEASPFDQQTGKATPFSSAMAKGLLGKLFPPASEMPRVVAGMAAKADAAKAAPKPNIPAGAAPAPLPQDPKASPMSVKNLLAASGKTLEPAAPAPKPAPAPAKAAPNAPAITPQAKPPTQAPKPAPKPAAPMQPPPAKPPVSQSPAGPTPMGGGARTPVLAALPSSAAAGSPMPAPKPMFQEARDRMSQMRAQRAAHDASPVGQQYKAMTQQKTGSHLPPAGEITKAAKRDMPGFLEQDRDPKAKEVYRALKREHPEYPAGKKARIAESASNKTSSAREFLSELDAIAKQAALLTLKNS